MPQDTLLLRRKLLNYGVRTKIYADANNQPLVNVERTLNTGERKTFKIGRRGNAYFYGKIDDVRIYSYVLSEDEIRAIYVSKDPVSTQN